MKLKVKIKKFRVCEEEFKAKFNEFEQVFEVLADLKTEFDSDK